MHITEQHLSVFFIYETSQISIRYCFGNEFKKKKLKYKYFSNLEQIIRCHIRKRKYQGLDTNCY